MKRAIMTCLVGGSVFTCGTSSFADSTTTLKDGTGNILKTDKMYCIRPTVIEPHLNITVGDSGYVKADDNNVGCQYAYKLVGDDRVKNRTVIAEETVRFEEMRRESNGAYRKTNNFLKAYDGYIRSTENEYNRIIKPGIIPKNEITNKFAKFLLKSPSNNGIELQIKYDGKYVWKTPFHAQSWEVQWIELQDQNNLNGNGITTFIFEPVQ